MNVCACLLHALGIYCVYNCYLNTIILNIPEEKAPGKGLPVKPEYAGMLVSAAKAWCQGILQTGAQNRERKMSREEGTIDIDKRRQAEVVGKPKMQAQLSTSMGWQGEDGLRRKSNH